MAGSDAPLGLVAGVKLFLVWIGGAVAGITAILYACGYLVARAHLSMLGLYGLVDLGGDYYLQEGSKFALATGFTVLRTALSPVIVVAVVAVVALLLAHALRRHRAPGWLVRARSRARGSGLLRDGAYVALFALLVRHALRYVDGFSAPLGVSNLLYADPLHPSASSAEAAELARHLLAGDGVYLAGAYGDLLLGATESLVLLYLAWRLAASAPWRRWLIAPFVATAAMYAFALPIAYGVLRRPVRYPHVKLTGTHAPGAERLFLLERSDAAFVVWDAHARRVAWVPREGLEAVELQDVVDIFGAAARPLAGAER